MGWLFEKPETVGTTRHVLMFKKFVVKFPRLGPWWTFIPEWGYLTNNLYLNRMEIKSCKEHAGKPGIPKIYFADPFGLIIIMKRYEPVGSYEYGNLLAELMKESDLPFEFWDNDSHIEQFGKDCDGKLVKIDLG